MNKKLPSALKRALKWLTKQACLSFLGGGGIVDPSALLKALNNNGSIVVGSIRESDSTATSATTKPISQTQAYAGNQGFQLITSKVQITSNDLRGSFVNGTANDEAVTLLHELGHAIYLFYGPPGVGSLPTNYGIQPDSGNVKASEANTQAIKDNCEK